MLRLDPPLVEDAARELGLTRVYFPVALVGTPELYRVFSRFYLALTVQPPNLLDQQEQLTTLLRHLLTRSGQPPPPPAGPVSLRSIERAREYLESHVADPVDLEDLSRVAGLSRFHLSRTFATAYGLSPHAYQNQLRLRAIRQRLRRGSRLDSLDAGFFDQSHLIRHFRDSMGMTPGEFASPLSALPPLD
jgi:AraC-like DNA-binding protein